MSHSHESALDTAIVFLPASIRKKAVMGFLAFGIVGLLATGLEMLQDGPTIKQALFSYLVAYLFALTICLGGLFFTLLQHLVGAVWSVTVRRIAEVLASILPLFAILFLPIAFGIRHLYPWSMDVHQLPLEMAEKVTDVLAKKGSYLNPTFFYLRAAFYFLCWSLLGSWVYSRSRKLDRTGDVTQLKKLRRGSAPAIILFGLTLTFAGFDWVMSLDPEWASTIFGVYMFAGAAVTSLATITGIALLLRSAGLLKSIITYEHYHDLGKLTFGFVVFWAYIAFSQYFLIWYANIPEETYFFGMRWFVNNGHTFSPTQEGWWAWVAKALLLCQFVAPFWLLLSRYSKRSPLILGISTCILLVAHYLDLYWFIIPNLHVTGNGFHGFDITTLLGIVGIVGSLVAYRLGSAALIPVKDPFLKTSVEFENV